MNKTYIASNNGNKKRHKGSGLEISYFDTRGQVLKYHILFLPLFLNYFANCRVMNTREIRDLF